jgi:RNA-directed DNA polymerase
LKAALVSGGYRFDVLERIALKDSSSIDLWSSRDALVLKAMTLCLERTLPIRPSCTHIRGHGGAKDAVPRVHSHLPQHAYVLGTDVKSYYASVDHHLLLDRLDVYISDRAVMNLLSQYIRRCICDGGNFLDIERGISLGCPLSPLMAAFFLLADPDTAAPKNSCSASSPGLLPCASALKDTAHSPAAVKIIIFTNNRQK